MLTSSKYSRSKVKINEIYFVLYSLTRNFAENNNTRKSYSTL